MTNLITKGKVYPCSRRLTDNNALQGLPSLLILRRIYVTEREGEAQRGQQYPWVEKMEIKTKM